MTRRSSGRGANRRRRTVLPVDDHVVERVRTLGPVVVVVGLALAVLAGLAVLPARTWLSQRENMNEARDELERVEAEVEVLRAELELLQTDGEVERLARAHFDLVYPGEESYRILPSDQTDGS